MSSKPSFNLNNEELATIKVSLELFVANDIEEIAPDVKLTQNELAISTINKISNNEVNFNAENLRIMAVALMFFQFVIEDTSSSSIDINLDKDTDKYLRIISTVLKKIEKTLNHFGHSLYSV
ncbi:hypothetical protein [Tissierella sp.]|uniref:hypothetical protein n=1 Tax=Tissierella sp. TaxID=41274 RepID=UPI00302DD51C